MTRTLDILISSLLIYQQTLLVMKCPFLVVVAIIVVILSVVAIPVPGPVDIVDISRYYM